MSVMKTALIVITLLASALTSTLASTSAFAGAKLKVNDAFPTTSLKKLGAAGQGSLSQYKGKVVVVDFWASWCEPCKKEIPELNSLYKKYKAKGVVVLGVNVDNEEATAKDFLKDNKVDFPLFHDEGSKLANQCNLATMPSSFVLDKTGKVKFVHAGYKEGDTEKFEKEIKSIL